MNILCRTAVTLTIGVALTLAPDAHAARKGKELLEYIPADTPYVFAYTKPFPDKLQERFEPALDKSLEAYRRFLRLKADEELAKLRAEEGGEEKVEQFEAFIGEILDLMSVDGLRNAGFGEDALFAVYGDGVLPVVRLAVSDIRRFEAVIERLEARADRRFDTGTVAGKSYRYRDFDEVRLVIATFGQDAVVTFVPPGYSDERLAQALGIKAPRNNLSKTRTVRDIAREYGFTDHVVGFVDVERLVATFTGDPGGLNAEFLELVGYDPSGITPECRAEFAEMAAVAPRMVMGYTHVGTDYLDSAMVVELRDDIAQGLASLPAIVPGLGTDLGGMFSFGFSLDPLALRNFFEARLDALEADPFECDSLAGIQAGMVAGGREVLAKPLPPMVYSFRGFLANVTDIQGMDIAADKPPESVDGGVLVAVENAEALVMMAAMMSPEVAELNLLPDGKAREVMLPDTAKIATQAFIALSESAMSIAMGAGASGNAEAMLAAKGLDSKPFFSFVMDTDRYYDFVGKAVMEGEPAEGEEPMSEEMRAAIRDAMISSGELYERMTINVHLTERGIEVGSRMTLAD